MTSVNGTTITMTRGDTFRGSITITDANGDIYIPSPNDEIIFTVKKDYDGYILIQKNIPVESLILEIEPQDTKQLDMPSSYVYDMQLTKEDGTVDTFIAKAKLKITEEVS